MFSDDLLEKIFENPQSYNVPIEYQTIMINVFEKVLKKIKEEYPYATLSELFSTTNADKLSEL